MRSGPKGLLRCQERKIIQCSNCDSIKPFKEVQIKKPEYGADDVRAYGSLCLKCHREYKTSWAKTDKQKKLEIRFINGEEGIHFCECGDYYVSKKSRFTTCWNCRRGEK